MKLKELQDRITEISNYIMKLEDKLKNKYAHTPTVAYEIRLDIDNCTNELLKLRQEFDRLIEDSNE
jgi:endoglucanase Acf2